MKTIFLTGNRKNKKPFQHLKRFYKNEYLFR